MCSSHQSYSPQFPELNNMVLLPVQKINLGNACSFQKPGLVPGGKIRLSVHTPVTALLNSKTLSFQISTYRSNWEGASTSTAKGADTAEPFPMEARETSLLKRPKEQALQDFCHRNHRYLLLLLLAPLLLPPVEVSLNFPLKSLCVCSSWVHPTDTGSMSLEISNTGNELLYCTLFLSSHETHFISQLLLIILNP